MLPALVRLVVERQQILPILGEARNRLQKLLNGNGLPLDSSSATSSGSTGDSSSQAQPCKSPRK